MIATGDIGIAQTNTLGSKTTAADNKLNNNLEDSAKQLNKKEFSDHLKDEQGHAEEAGEVASTASVADPAKPESGSASTAATPFTTTGTEPTGQRLLQPEGKSLPTTGNPLPLAAADQAGDKPIDTKTATAALGTETATASTNPLLNNPADPQLAATQASLAAPAWVASPKAMHTDQRATSLTGATIAGTTVAGTTVAGTTSSLTAEDIKLAVSTSGQGTNQNTDQARTGSIELTGPTSAATGKAAPELAVAADSLATKQPAVTESLAAAQAAPQLKAVNPEALAAVERLADAPLTINKTTSDGSYVQGLGNLKPEMTAAAGKPDVFHTYVPQEVGKAGWSESIMQKVMWMSSSQLSKAEIALDPPELGPLQIRISTQSDQTSVAFTSASPAVRESLDQGLARLRELFESQGLDLANVDVSDHGNPQANAEEADAGADDGGEAVVGQTAADEAGEPAQLMAAQRAMGIGLIDQFV